MKRLEGTTLTYQCTKFGYLLAWIIESFDENCDEDLIQNEIYTLVSDIFTIREYSSASNIFFSKFVKKCNDRKEFKNIIALFRQGVSEGNLSQLKIYFNIFGDLILKMYRQNSFQQLIF